MKEDKRINKAKRQYIEEFYKTKTDKEIGKAMQISGDAVGDMRRRMGLSKVGGGFRMF